MTTRVLTVSILLGLFMNMLVNLVWFMINGRVWLGINVLFAMGVLMYIVDDSRRIGVWNE